MLPDKRLTCLFVLFLLVGMAPAAWAGAKTETAKGRTVTRVTKMEVAKVGDVKGHVMGVIQRSGLTSFENGEVATYSSTGTFDSTKGKGSHQGYSVRTHEDGSTIVLKWRGTHAPGQGGKTTVAEGTFEYVSGTARFEGVEGNGSYSCNRIVPFAAGGDMYCDFTATLTLPSS
ncbi:MAG: hypothetical protein ACE5NC_08035 [Anaerolineae bacterium]